jgi:hypothetical protein
MTCSTGTRRSPAGMRHSRAAHPLQRTGGVSSSEEGFCIEICEGTSVKVSPAMDMEWWTDATDDRSISCHRTRGVMFSKSCRT